jgi:hypothetical protein
MTNHREGVQTLGRSFSDDAAVCIVKAKPTPEMEARTLLHELMHGQYQAVNCGDSAHLIECQRRFHELVVAHPEIGERYGYDAQTQIWTLRVDPVVEQLIEQGVLPKPEPLPKEMLH